VDHEQRNEIVLGHLHVPKLVAKVVCARLPRRVDLFDDLHASCNLLLVEAAEKYDTRRSVPFDKWATRYLFWRIFDTGRLRRRALREALHLGLSEVADTAVEPEQYANAQRSRRCQVIEIAIARAGLSKREEEITRRRFWHGDTIVAISRELGITKEYTSKVGRAALRKVRAAEPRLAELADDAA
jgi:RNA polymerase sigma factor (sigma-70 family)